MAVGAVLVDDCVVVVVVARVVLAAPALSSCYILIN